MVGRHPRICVFRLLLTEVDDFAVSPETAIAIDQKPAGTLVKPDVLEQMISNYEDELAKLTDEPDTLEDQEFAIEERLDELQVLLRNMEGRISETTKQRKEVYDRYSRLSARRDEITELQSRFQLLDQQYTSDLERLVAIEESGQFFVLREPMPCPLCGALPEGQHHDAACDGMRR